MTAVLPAADEETMAVGTEDTGMIDEEVVAEVADGTTVGGGTMTNSKLVR